MNIFLLEMANDGSKDEKKVTRFSSKGLKIDFKKRYYKKFI